MKQDNHKWFRVFSMRNVPAIAVAWSLACAPLHVFAAGWDPAQQQIVSKIERFAYRHAEHGKLETQSVIALFKDNTVGLTPLDIGTIYETAFAKRADALRSDLPHMIASWGGWLLAALAFVALLLGNAIKASAGRLWDAAVSELLRWFARARFAQRRALRNHRSDARSKYRRLSIPFRREPLDLGKVFVPLGVHAAARTVSTIDAVKAFETHKRMMVLGAPGSGKSVLLKHLTLHYSEGGFDLLVPWALTVLIELHRFNDLALDKISVREQILEALKRSGVKSPEPLLDGALERKSLILLFDGLDEVNSDRRRAVAGKVADFLEEQGQCRAVITCRTQVYDHEFDTVCDEIFEIEEFGDAQIRQFLESWQSQMPEGKSADQLVATLADRPRILALARNPLVLTIIAYLYVDTQIKLPHSRAEFYQRATFILLEEWKEERNKFKASEKVAVLRHLALEHQRRIASEGRDRLAVAADDVLAAIGAIMPTLNNLPAGATRRELLSEIVERSGLMIAVDGGQRYQFAHLTLQEFFAADALRGDFRYLLQLFQEDRHRWRESVKLWCGLADDATRMIHYLSKIESFTALECLADARKVDEAVADDLIEKLKPSIATASTQAEAAQAFGALASDTRGKRGPAMFYFLVKTIDESVARAASLNLMRSVLRVETIDESADLAAWHGAMVALAATNLPAAAAALAQVYAPDDEVLRASMVRLGDLAITALNDLAKSGSVYAIEDLQRIGTARAAEALAGLLFHDDIAIAKQAAWRLATFFGRSEIEQHLRKNARPPSSYDSTGSWAWVWQPFEDDAKSPLIKIAGRIVELISATTGEEVDFYSNITTMDERIMIASLIDQIKEFDGPRLPEGIIPSRMADATELQKLKELIASRITNRKISLIISLCPVNIINIVAGMIKDDRSTLLRQYREQFETIRHPLSYPDTWCVLIIQTLLTIIVSTWFVLTPIFTFFGYPLPNPIDPFHITYYDYIIPVFNFGLPMIIILLLREIPPKNEEIHMTFSTGMVIYSIAMLAGALAVPIIIIMALYENASSFSAVVDFFSKTKGFFTNKINILVSCLFASSFVASIYYGIFIYSWYSYIDYGWISIACMALFLALMASLHWLTIRRAERVNNVFRGKFVRGF